MYGRLKRSLLSEMLLKINYSLLFDFECSSFGESAVILYGCTNRCRPGFVDRRELKSKGDRVSDSVLMLSLYNIYIYNII